MMLKKVPFEMLIWIAALVLLAFSNFKTSDESLCLLNNLGITWCPGCGLGHSIAALLHGEVLKSIEYHWLGIPALICILYRILQLWQFERKKKQRELTFKI